MMYIDDASRKCRCLFLKTKDHVFECFKKFYSMIEREKGVFLNCLHSENGGEYMLKEFEACCSEHGIRDKKAAPRTPQHNGVDKKNE